MHSSTIHLMVIYYMFQKFLGTSQRFVLHSNTVTFIIGTAMAASARTNIFKTIISSNESILEQKLYKIIKILTQAINLFHFSI